MDNSGFSLPAAHNSAVGCVNLFFTTDDEEPHAEPLLPSFDSLYACYGDVADHNTVVLWAKSH